MSLSIEITGGQMLIDAGDLALLGDRSVYLGVNGYAYFSVWPTGPVTVHSFVMGGARAGYHIDHINGVKLDNRRSNLRFATLQANQVNRKNLNRNNSSGARGVTVREGTRNPYIAQLMVDGRQLYLGSFCTLELAIGARRAAELEHFGQVCP